MPARHVPAGCNLHQNELRYLAKKVEMQTKDILRSVTQTNTEPQSSPGLGTQHFHVSASRRRTHTPQASHTPTPWAGPGGGVGPATSLAQALYVLLGHRIPVQIVRLLEAGSGNTDAGIQGVDQRRGEGEIPFPYQQEAPGSHGLLWLPAGALWSAHFASLPSHRPRLPPPLLCPALVNDASTAYGCLVKHSVPIPDSSKPERAMELSHHLRAPRKARLHFSTGTDLSVFVTPA